MRIGECNYVTHTPDLRRSLGAWGGCRFSSVLLSRRLVLAFAVLVTVGVMGVLVVFIGIAVAVMGTLVLIRVAVAVMGVPVLIRIAIGVMGVLVVVIIAVAIRPVGFAVPREADLLLDLVEVMAPSHGVLQTQSRDLLNNRLHDKLDADFH